MIRSLVLALCLALPLSALAQDDASLLAPLAPHPAKSHKKKAKHRHNDLDQLAPLNLPTTLSVNVPGVEGAQVVVDGKDWGKAPVDGRKIRPGAHRIRVSRPGFAPFKRRVVVRTGDRAQVAAKLRPVSGVLTVRTTPPGAEVSLDGERLGLTPLLQKVVRPGSYELRLRAEGFMNDLSRIALRAGQDTVIDRSLVAAPKPTPLAQAKPADRPVQVALSPRVAPEAGPLPTEQYAEVEPPKAWYQHWYVWAGAGAVVAAAAVGIAASSGGTTVGAPPLASAVCGGACDGVLTP